MPKFIVHPACDIFPPLDASSFEALKSSIQESGLFEPVILLDGMIIDGRARAQICAEIGIEPVTAAMSGRDPVSYVIAKNAQRRHLSNAQRSLIAAKVAQMKIGDNQHHRSGLPIGEASRLLTVSPRSVSRARSVIARCHPDVVDYAVQGKLSISVAEDFGRYTHEEQLKYLNSGSRPPRPIKAAILARPEIGDDHFHNVSILWAKDQELVAAWSVADRAARQRFVAEVLGLAISDDSSIMLSHPTDEKDLSGTNSCKPQLGGLGPLPKAGVQAGLLKRRLGAASFTKKRSAIKSITLPGATSWTD